MRWTENGMALYFFLGWNGAWIGLIGLMIPCGFGLMN